MTAAITRLAYAGQNGQPYTAIGRTLIDQNELTREDGFAADHPRLAGRASGSRAGGDGNRQKLCLLPRGGDGRSDAGRARLAGRQHHALASIAVDRHYHALGAPFYVAADGPDPVHALMVAQDTGGAIKGAARADIFFGPGDDAEGRAGMLKAHGTLFVLLPNKLAEHIGYGWDYDVP